MYFLFCLLHILCRSLVLLTLFSLFLFFSLLVSLFHVLPLSPASLLFSVFLPLLFAKSSLLSLSLALSEPSVCLSLLLSSLSFFLFLSLSPSAAFFHPLSLSLHFVLSLSLSLFCSLSLSLSPKVLALLLFLPHSLSVSSLLSSFFSVTLSLSLAVSFINTHTLCSPSKGGSGPKSVRVCAETSGAPRWRVRTSVSSREVRHLNLPSHQLIYKHKTWNTFSEQSSCGIPSRKQDCCEDCSSRKVQPDRMSDKPTCTMHP